MGESERLGLLINHLKTNAFNFSKQAKIAQGTVSSILKKKRRLSRDLIDQISLTYPNINIDWLLRGIGDMFHQELEHADIAGEPTVEYVAIKSTKIELDGLPDRIHKFILFGRVGARVKISWHNAYTSPGNWHDE